MRNRDRLDRSRLSKHTGSRVSELSKNSSAATLPRRTALIEVFDLLGKELERRLTVHRLKRTDSETWKKPLFSTCHQEEPLS